MGKKLVILLACSLAIPNRVPHNLVNELGPVAWCMKLLCQLHFCDLGIKVRLAVLLNLSFYLFIYYFIYLVKLGPVLLPF